MNPTYHQIRLTYDTTQNLTTFDLDFQFNSEVEHFKISYLIHIISKTTDHLIQHNVSGCRMLSLLKLLHLNMTTF